jgi:hypothetical protein
VAKPMKLGDAIANKIIANETLGYFIGRTYLFMLKIGIDPARCKPPSRAVAAVMSNFIFCADRRRSDRSVRVMLSRTSVMCADNVVQN